MAQLYTALKARLARIAHADRKSDKKSTELQKLSESSARNTGFKCKPLQHPTDTIRLVQVLPPLGLSTLKCALKHCSLSSGRYEALSYEWGSPNDERVTILVNGYHFRVR